MDRMKHLKYMVANVLPQVYDESLSYYEVLSKVTAIVNELIDEVSSIESITEASVKNVIDEMIENGEFADIISDEVLGELNQRITDVEDDVEELQNELNTNKNYLFVGDSWATGYIDGSEFAQPWPDKVKELLGLDNDHYHKIANNGCGFHLTSDNNFANLIESNYTNVPNRDTVTDIIVGACLNDTYDYNYNNVANGLGQFATKCRTYFPNAKITLFPTGWSMFASRKLVLENVFYVYERSCPGVGITYVDGIQYAVVDGNLFPATNGSHVSDEGQLLVARGIVNWLRHGTIGEAIHRTAVQLSLQTPDNGAFDFCEVSYAMRKKMLKFSNTVMDFSTPIAVNGWNATELGYIESRVLQGTNGAVTTIPSTIRIRSNGVYRTVPCAFAFVQDVNNWQKVNVRLYAYITDDNGSLNIADVDQIRLSTNTIEITPYMI